jgi:purine-binding chemotaxis protein CheW
VETKRDKIDLVIFRILGDEFGVDVHSTREILRMEDVASVPQAPDFIEGIINVRGYAVAVLDLRKRFGVKEPENTEKTRIMIVRSRKMIVGVIVDVVIGVKSFEASAIQATPRVVTTQVDHRYISGVTRLNKKMIFIVNLDEILTGKSQEYLETAVAMSRRGEEAQRKQNPSESAEQE